MTRGDSPSRVVGFLGPRGTFTEGAARTYGAAFARLVPFADIPELLRATARGDIDEAVVPVENSIEGTVNVTLDTLVHDVQLAVRADIVLPIRHHLLIRPGIDWQQVQVVVSHPQALAQCRRWLDGHLPGVSVEAALSTAAAAARVGAPDGVESAREIAAIGNAFSAELYGLDIAVQNIQDESVNETRFFVIGRPGEGGGVEGDAARRDGEREHNYKTSVAFAFEADGPGNLYGALGEFARHEVNLTKLESRPARQALGQYIFFVDMEGHVRDESVAGALEALRRECTFVKILGSYPRVG